MKKTNVVTDAELQHLSVIADRLGDDRSFAVIAAAGRGCVRSRQIVADTLAQRRMEQRSRKAARS